MADTTITLPRERAEQLRRLAKHRNIKVSTLVGELVERELERSGLDRRIPGFDVAYLIDGDERRLILDFQQCRIQESPTAISAWVSFMERALDGRGGGTMLDEGAVLSARRQGPGLILEGLDVNRAQFTISLPPGLARSIIAEIREALAEIDAQK